MKIVILTLSLPKGKDLLFADLNRTHGATAGPDSRLTPKTQERILPY
jgi:hypothetical protein